MAVNVDIEEKILCQRLRDQCFLNGKEKDPKICAVTFWRLAKLYMAFSDEPMSFIRSAVFLNAAISRSSPESAKSFKDDLKNLHSIILQKAKARNKNTVLANLSSQVKESVKKLRQECSDSLHPIKYPNKRIPREREAQEKSFIKECKTSQTKIKDEYVKIMKQLFDECVKIMGPPPCKFSVVGVGDIARKEVTPFSEFHHLILLQDRYSKSHSIIRNYFTWLEVIFHVALINLGETPITDAILKRLNWFHDSFTTPGISACGIFKLDLLYPLEREDSVKTGIVRNSSELTNYLSVPTSTKKSSEESDLDIAQLLTKTCYVTGNEVLYRSLYKKIKSTLKMQRKCDSYFCKTLLNRIAEDRKNLEALSKMYFLHSDRLINFRLVIFRSISAMISTLGIIYGIKAFSPIEIIETLHKKEIIAHDAAHKLCRAAAVAYHCQIHIHLKYLRRFESTSQEHAIFETLPELYKGVGVWPVIGMIISGVNLQHVFGSFASATTLDERKHLRFGSWSFLRATVLCSLHLYSLCLQDCKKIQNETVSKGSVEAHVLRFLLAVCYYHLNRPNQALPFFRKTLRILPDPGTERVTCFYYMGLCNLKNNNYKIASSFLKSGLQMQTQASIAEGSDRGLVKFLLKLSTCAKNLNQMSDALEYLNRGLEIRRAHPSDFKDNESSWLNEIGQCYYQLREDDTALDYFRKSVIAYRKECRDERTDKLLANLLYNLAACLRETEQFEEALTFFQEEMRIRLNLGDENSNDIRDCQRAIEHCKEQLGYSTVF